MQIVIDLPDKLYKKIQMELVSGEVCECVKNGIPLPKGHGRLIDADALNFNADYNEPLISKLDFDQAQTIIAADKSHERSDDDPEWGLGR